MLASATFSIVAEDSSFTEKVTGADHSTTFFQIVAIGTRGTGHEYLFVILLVARANNIQSFRCKARSAEHSMRITVGYGDPARGQARKLLRST